MALYEQQTEFKDSPVADRLRFRRNVPDISSLTLRETEILNCLSLGRSNKEIACDLDIAEATVKVHVKTLLRKLRVKNRTQAALWALQPKECNTDD
jgi:DNA-binding NarL/FixJ family response regulator